MIGHHLAMTSVAFDVRIKPADPLSPRTRIRRAYWSGKPIYRIAIDERLTEGAIEAALFARIDAVEAGR